MRMKYFAIMVVVLGCLSVVAFIDIGDDVFGIVPTGGFSGHKEIDFAYPPPLTETPIPYPPPIKPKPATATATLTELPTATAIIMPSATIDWGTPRTTPGLDIIIATGCVGWCPYITATYSNP